MLCGVFCCVSGDRPSDEFSGANTTIFRLMGHETNTVVFRISSLFGRLTDELG
jgi:hypothetical protein